MVTIGPLVIMNIASTKTTICYACSEIIPAESMFCPYCKKELLVTCPKCGKIYSSQYSVCNKCGTDRHDYYLKQEARKQEARRREKEREQAELEERKRQEEEANKEKTANTVVYFIMIPIFVLEYGTTQQHIGMHLMKISTTYF